MLAEKKSRKARLPQPKVIYVDFIEDRSDRVTYGGIKLATVGEVGLGTSSIQTSKSCNRQPRELSTPRETDYMNLNPDIKPIPKGKKWCSQCGEWRDKDGFTRKEDAHDKLHPHCNICRAAHARRIYWLKKEAAVSMPIAA